MILVSTHQVINQKPMVICATWYMISEVMDSNVKTDKRSALREDDKRRKLLFIQHLLSVPAERNMYGFSAVCYCTGCTGAWILICPLSWLASSQMRSPSPAALWVAGVNVGRGVWQARRAMQGRGAGTSSGLQVGDKATPEVPALKITPGSERPPQHINEASYQRTGTYELH